MPKKTVKNFLSRGGRNRTYTNGFGDRCTTTIRRPLAANSVTRPTKNRELFALGVGGVLLAEAAIFTQRKLFLHLLLIALGVMRNLSAQTTLQLGHVVLNLAHTRYTII